MCYIPFDVKFYDIFYTYNMYYKFYDDFLYYKFYCAVAARAEHLMFVFYVFPGFISPEAFGLLDFKYL